MGIPLVAGAMRGQSDVPLMFDFTVTNHGSSNFPSGSPSVTVFYISYFVPSNASITDVECVQTQGDHYDIIAAAQNACGLLGLRVHTTIQSAIDAFVNSDTAPPDPFTVEVCAGTTIDSKTHCGTVTVPLFD